MYWIALQPEPEPQVDVHTAWAWWALQFTPRVARVDDALVLEMLARAWPHSVDPAVSASAKPARLSGSENLS